MGIVSPLADWYSPSEAWLKICIVLTDCMARLELPFRGGQAAGVNCFSGWPCYGLTRRR